ncbi:MAG TPA: LysE family transporter [Coriobacteriia bacterium]
MSIGSGFLRALGIGFLVAAPVGAMALLCIERTLARGRASGYATGAGIATADALYASIAAFGLTALTGALTGAQGWVRLVGGAFLVYLGIRAMLSRPGRCAEDVGAVPLLGVYGSALGLTLANPQTILSFVGIFAGAGLVVSGGGWATPAVIVAGVFAGSLGWWVLLVTVTGALRERVGERVLLWVTRVSGAAIAVLGVAAIWAGAQKLIG